MSVIMSLMYAAGAIALLAVVLECCCRRRMRELRDAGPHIVALNGVNMNNVPYPVEASFPTAPPVVGSGGTVIFPMPMPAVVAVNDDADCFFRPYPQDEPQPHNKTVESEFS
ncbi:hypothetical protein O0L34_g1773 [Tuta absoluta]|nr:hypothetical protein O0L34_g1773 [Tuta absoluta]